MSPVVVRYPVVYELAVVGRSEEVINGLLAVLIIITHHEIATTYRTHLTEPVEHEKNGIPTCTNISQEL